MLVLVQGVAAAMSMAARASQMFLRRALWSLGAGAMVLLGSAHWGETSTRAPKRKRP